MEQGSNKEQIRTNAPIVEFGSVGNRFEEVAVYREAVVGVALVVEANVVPFRE
jgi:hypothetical protein